MSQHASLSLVFLKQFVCERGGAAAWLGIWRSLSEEQQKDYKRCIEDRWCSYRLLIDIVSLGAKVFSEGLVKFAGDFGAYEVEKDIPQIYRMAARLGGPGLLVLESNRLWKRYHRTGCIKHYDVFPNSVRSQVIEWEGGDPCLCALVAGYVRRGVELCGAKDVEVVHTRCRFRGDTVCEYFVSWGK